MTDWTNLCPIWSILIYANLKDIESYLAQVEYLLLYCSIYNNNNNN